jgi:hypothetical protein
MGSGTAVAFCFGSGGAQVLCCRESRGLANFETGRIIPFGGELTNAPIKKPDNFNFSSGESSRQLSFRR